MAQLSNINFNLLKSLQGLLTHHSVTQAAKQSHITPSAMSLNLKQLREILEDALLVRGQAGQMYLTPKAEQLIPLVNQTLQSIQELFSTPTEINPKNFNTEISLGMSPSDSSIILPYLLKIIKTKAPNLKLVIKTLTEITSPSIFINKDIHLGISYLDVNLNHINKTKLYSDTAVLIAKPTHSVWKKFDGKINSIRHCHMVVFTQRSKIFSEPHLVHQIKNLHQSCEINLIVSDPLVAIQSVAENNAVTYVPERFAMPLLKRYGLIAKPLANPKMPKTHLYWHDITENDPVCQWLRGELRGLFR